MNNYLLFLIRKFVDNTILALFSILLGITVICALRSENFNLSNVSARIFLLPLVICCCLLMLKNYRVRNFLSTNKSLILSVVMCTLIVIFQFVLVYKTHPVIGFDIYHFYRYIVDSSRDDATYFSYYPNNLLLLLLQKGYLTLTNSVNDYFLSLDILNIILVDISAILNVIAIYIYDKSKALIGTWINMVWLLLFPMIIIPYSDTVVLPFVSLLLLMYVVIIKSSNICLKIISIIILGCVTSFIYFLKPSSIIPFIAICVMGIFGIKNLKIKNILLMLLLAVSLCSSYAIIKTGLNSQDYIKIDASYKMPMTHFIEMGMKGQSGSYDQASVDAMKSSNKKKKERYIKSHIKETLTNRGWLGYIKFLLTKQGYNTADGTFGWLKEGNFIGNSSKDKPNTFKEYLYPDGKYLYDFKFIAQFIWLIGLVILLLGFNDRRYFVQVLRLSLIGAFVFLLIFEGGRSRYMIQFLPAIIMLITLLWDTSMQNLKRINDVLFNKENIISD